MNQYEELRLRGFRYDVRVLNAPLEVMVHRKTVAAATAPLRSGMVAHLLLESLEHVLELRAAGVHAAVWRRHVTADSACSCGLVIFPGLSCASSDGHLDFTMLEPTHRFVTASDDAPQPFEAVCRPCAWAHGAGSAGEAERLLAAHVCGAS